MDRLPAADMNAVISALISASNSDVVMCRTATRPSLRQDCGESRKRGRMFLTLESISLNQFDRR